jgi:hypothetical protein
MKHTAATSPVQIQDLATTVLQLLHLHGLTITQVRDVLGEAEWRLNAYAGRVIDETVFPREAAVPRSASD